MAKRKKRRGGVGAISTTEWLLIAGAAAVGLYLVMKPTTQNVVRVPVTSPGASQATLTAAEITAGAGVATSLINALSSSSDDDES